MAHPGRLMVDVGYCHNCGGVSRERIQAQLSLVEKVPQRGDASCISHTVVLRADLEEHPEDVRGSAISPPEETRRVLLVVVEVGVVHEESDSLGTAKLPNTVVTRHEEPLPAHHQDLEEDNNHSLCQL